MQLTHYTDYGLRVLIYLALQETQRRVTIAEIAQHFKIPRNHLVKVVHRLGQLNYIESTRGRNGGIILARVADKMVIGDIVRQMETTLEIVNCELPAPCPIKPGCRLKSILNNATEAFLNVLDQYTIADLQQKSGQIQVLLNIDSIVNSKEGLTSEP